MTPPLARLTPQSRDSPKSAAETERLRRQIARDAPRGDRLGDEILALQARLLHPPLSARLPPRPFSASPNEPSRAQLCHPPTRPSTPALAQNTMDEEARLAADAHSTVRARVESLEARVEDQRRRLRESFDETERLRETRRSRRRGSLLLLRRTVFAKLIDMRGVDWSVEDARWMAEEWTREARKLESYLE